MSGWKRVSKSKPCPVCQKNDWCSVAQDGSVVCCQRVQSDWVCKGASGGWIHKLDPTVTKRIKNVFRRSPKKSALSPIYWHNLVKRSLEIGRDTARSLETGRERPPVCVLANELGVSIQSLNRLLVGWLPQYEAWTFPMWDGRGRMVGIRLRGNNGRKWCVPGSKNGIFWPTEIARELPHLLMICEGPTDCAALLDLGFDAIGRPNALGGCQQLTDFLRGARRRVVIVIDRPSKDAVEYPGAVTLSQAIKPLTTEVSILQLPGGHKDIRAWYNAGGTREMLLTVIS